MLNRPPFTESQVLNIHISLALSIEYVLEIIRITTKINKSQFVPLGNHEL